MHVLDAATDLTAQMGGADIGALRMVETFARAGWRVTVAWCVARSELG